MLKQSISSPKSSSRRSQKGDDTPVYEQDPIREKCARNQVVTVCWEESRSERGKPGREEGELGDVGWQRMGEGLAQFREGCSMHQPGNRGRFATDSQAEPIRPLVHVAPKIPSILIDPTLHRQSFSLLSTNALFCELQTVFAESASPAFGREGCLGLGMSKPSANMVCML